MEDFRVYIVVRSDFYLLDILHLLKEKRKTHNIKFHYSDKGTLKTDLILEGFEFSEKLYYSFDPPNALITCYPNAVFTEQCREQKVKIRILK